MTAAPGSPAPARRAVLRARPTAAVLAVVALAGSVRPAAEPIDARQRSLTSRPSQPATKPAPKPVSKPAVQPAGQPAVQPAAKLDLSSWWWIPNAAERAVQLPAAARGFASGVDLYENGRFEDALPLVGNPALATTLLADYSLYYTALTRQALGQLDEARAAFNTLRARGPRGALTSLVVTRAAEAASAALDHAAAVTLYEEALAARYGETAALLLGLARSAAAGGDARKAFDAYTRVYREFPATEHASAAETELSQSAEWGDQSAGGWRVRVERERADRLFIARQYHDALAAYELVARHATGDDRDLVRLRQAQCDYHLRRYRAARDALTPLAGRGALTAEALFYLASAERALGDPDRFSALTRRLVDEHGTTSWAEDGLNALGTYYILEDEDAQAGAIFREIYARWPRGRHAERAAWKAGWWAYRQGQWNEAVRIFDDAAVGFPRSDYRPSWLYWAARARERAGDRAGAAAAFDGVVASYRNTYYGRRAMKVAATVRKVPSAAAGGRSAGAGAPAPATAVPASGAVKAPPGLPENYELIRLLIELELFDLAQQELTAAERSWGQSPALLATEAWVAQAQGESRRGIILMKRAYPALLRAVPGDVPRELVSVVLPLEHWASIKRYAAAHKLDPYLIAGMINQESTFVADIRSRAGAIGLMQVMPATGRRYARRLGIRRFSAASLTRADINLRIGTAYLADLLRQFKALHLALAAYNAGEPRASVWLSERPGLAVDEFIDDLPFPETQVYVRRVLGLAEDYREFYAGAPTISKSQTSPSVLSGRK